MSNNEKIDITMTATKRPDLIRRTLKSYCKNLFQEREKYRLIINIDPVGENINPTDIIDICESYFDEIVYNIPDTPSFPRAVIWTWGQVISEFVFHLEDDWLLDRYINIYRIMQILREEKEIACLRFSKYPIPNSNIVSLFNSKYVYNPKGFFITDNSKNQFGLNPVLIKGEFVKSAVPLMVETKNPEKQFRYNNDRMRNFVMSWKYAIYGNPGDPILAIDNGVKWKKINKFHKPKDGQFLKWESN